MIRVFSTQFPLNPEGTLEKFIETGKKWISGSYYTSFTPAEVKGLNSGQSIQKKGYSLEIQDVKIDNYSAAGLQYITQDRNGDNFYSKIIGLKTKDSFWISMAVDYESSQERTFLPKSKKPCLIQFLLNDIGGGRDGDFIVSDKPIILKDEEGIEIFLSDILKGEAGSVMPITYVSKDNQNFLSVDPNSLARQLAGLSHVIVEPSREFSFRLKEQMRGNNIYAGAVGVYWTEGIGKYYWTPDELTNEPVKMISGMIESALNTKKIRRDLTWENLQSLQKFEQIKKIREEYTLKEKKLQTDHADIKTRLDLLEVNKKELEGILDMASQEIAGKEALLKEAEEKNKDLERKLFRLTHTPSRSYNEGIINPPQKTEIYEGEIRTVVHDILEQFYKQCPLTVRKSQIVKEILDATPRPERREEVINEIKNIFRDYTKISQLEKALGDLGFVIRDEGKHYKINRADAIGGISVTFSKTPSDCRTGKNTVAEITRAFL